MGVADDAMAEFNKELYGEETPASRTKRIFDQGGPFAAAQIIDLVHNSPSDSIKLRAAQYVVDRVLGPVGKDEQQDALQEFLQGIEKLANSNNRDRQ